MSHDCGAVQRESHAKVTTPKLTPKVISLFLMGDRDAILQVANCRHAVWLGLLFVISAGFAREYDGESLLHEPWHLLIPLAASLVTSSFLFWLVSLVAHRRGSNIFRQPGVYRSFLGLFWMTAPLAWLYAIPVERFMNAENATAANLTFLAIVATWRVVLVIRMIAVVFGARRLFDVIAIVLLFADCVMLIAVFAMPTPVWSLMGGVRLTESEQLMLNVTLQTKIWGILSLPIWMIGFIVACRRQPPWNLAIQPGQDQRKAGRSCWMLAGFSIAIWAAILPFTQPEQYLRQRVENELQSDRILAGLQLMSQRDRSEFPPHWDPPPRTGYGEHKPDIYQVLDTAAGTEDCASWVRELYVEKFLNSLPEYRIMFQFPDGKRGYLADVIDILEQIPESRRPFAKFYQDHPWEFSAESDLPASVRRRLQELAGLWPASPAEEKAREARREQLRREVSTAPDGVREFIDIEYAKVDGASLTLDCYVPSDAETRHPLLVWVHGGGWIQGSKNWCPLKWLTGHGYVVASVNYRLSNVAPFPAQIHDCKGAIRWMRANAADFGIDPQRVGVAGISAGGHLAALLGTTGDIAALEGSVGGNLEQSSRIQAVVDMCGMADFTLMIRDYRDYSQRDDTNVARLFGGPPAEAPELAQLASPYRHITSDDAPLFIVHGEEDPLVPLLQSRLMIDQYGLLDLDCSLEVIRTEEHVPLEFWDHKRRALMREFWDKHLKP